MPLKDTWKVLLKNALELLDLVHVPSDKWSIGGGTVLYVFWRCPRISKDIDIFITDAQLLTYLSPRLNDFAESLCDGNYEEQSNFVKLVLPEGDIDFILSPRLTEKPVVERSIEPIGTVYADTPWEVVAKKFFYRANYFAVRDVIDLLCVLELYSSEIPRSFWDLLRKRLSELEARWSYVKKRIDKGFSSISFDLDRLWSVQSVRTPESVCSMFEAFLERLAS